MIGVFDSGLGGLSVWRELVKVIPDMPVVYFADGANCPIGSKPETEILKITVRAVEFLLAKGCQLIVLACNTATAVAIEDLRATYTNISFVGMEPAIKPAALQTKSGVIGVLATFGTFKGRLYQNTKKIHASNVEVVVRAGEGLVELVENSEIHTQKALELVGKYISPMLEKGADHIVLGCTHYPFLSPVINQLTNGNITLVDPAPAVCKQVVRLLKNIHTTAYSNDSAYSFYTTGDTNKVIEMLNDITVQKHFTVVQIS